MILPFTDGLLRTNHFDPEMAALADRHYSRRTVGARQFCYSGRKLVLRNWEGTVLFVWMNPDASMRMDGQTGYNCAIFRNESARKSSEIILEAEQFAFREWGPARLYTYVNPDKIESVNPGWCFKIAGWKYVRKSKSGQHLLVKEVGGAMSRSNYSDDGEYLNLWRGAVAAAIKGKRGQAFLREMLVSLDALPEKALISGKLQRDGDVCALGSVAKSRALDVEHLDPYEYESIALLFNIPQSLAREIMYENDQWVGDDETSQQRWIRMHKWVESNLRA
jgi:hypothetical protein